MGWGDHGGQHGRWQLKKEKKKRKKYFKNLKGEAIVNNLSFFKKSLSGIVEVEKLVSIEIKSPFIFSLLGHMWFNVRNICQYFM